ncbi:MAG TPA: hypothetical protein PLY45_03060, partial [bacterium]|nr:hypothetical protein [bacterium]
MEGNTGNASTSRLILPVAVFAALFVLRLPALMHPVLDVDEAIYGLFARVWFDGGTPYVDCVETKPLGIYAFYGFIFSLFGKFNMIAVHAATIGVVGLTALVIGKIAVLVSPALKDPDGAKGSVGWLAALLYLVFSTTYIPKVIATTIEPILLLFTVLQFWLWMRFEREGKWRIALASGVAFSAACCFKYQAGMNLIVMLAYLSAARPAALGRSGLGRSLKGFAIFLAGAVPVPLAMLACLHQAGALDGFIFWNVSGNAAYISGGASSISLAGQLLKRVLPYVASTALLWVLTAIGSVRLFRGLKHREAEGLVISHRLLVFLWFVLSIVPVSAGYRFYGHYFLLLLPPMSVLAAPVLLSILNSRRKLTAWLAIFWIALPAAGFFAARFFIPEINRAFGEDNLADYGPAAEYAAANTRPSDRIVVWGFAPMIYWGSERLPGTRFFWSDLLVGRVPGSKKGDGGESEGMREAWEMFMADMERHRPALFIDTSPA